MLVRPAIMYFLDTGALTKTHEAELEVKVLRFQLGLTGMASKYIKGTTKVERLGGKDAEARLKRD